IGEGIRAVIVGGRGVGHRRAVVRDAAVSALGDAGDGKGLARVRGDGIIGQDVDDVVGAVLIHRRDVIVGGGVVVHRCDVEAGRGGGGQRIRGAVGRAVVLECV